MTRQMTWRWWFALPLFLACSPAAAPPRRPADPWKGVDCKKVSAPAEPELLAWDPRLRAELDRQRRQGVVAVRYETDGCDVTLELLPQCVGPKNKYVYSARAATASHTAKDEEELLRQLPLGAANVLGPLRERGRVRWDVEEVGVSEVPTDGGVSSYDFVGPECKRATHFVRAVHVGGFGLAAGTGGETFGAGASGEALAREGTPVICDRARTEKVELGGCAAPLRVSLAPFDGRAEPAASGCPSCAAKAEEDAGAVGAVFDQGTVERVTRQHQARIRRACWEKGTEALRRITVLVTMHIGTNGKVASLSTSVRDADGPRDVAQSVARCVEGDVRTWQFPEPEAEKDVTLPFHLLRQ